MEFLINDIIETDKQVIIKIEVNNEIKDFGFPLLDLEIDPILNEPYWVNKIKNIVLDLYTPKADIGIKSVKTSDYKNNILNTDNLIKLDNKSIRERKKLRDLERLSNPKVEIDDTEIITEIKNKRIKTENINLECGVMIKDKNGYKPI